VASFFPRIFSATKHGRNCSFQHFIERGLALSASNFFLLYFYGLELHHLNSNFIAHLAIFVHLYEAFLGIEPHFALFGYLFHVKPQPSEKDQSVVGGAGFQLKQKMDQNYIDYQSSSSLSGWKDRWFSIGNHKPALLERTEGVAQSTPEWDQNPNPTEMDHVKELIDIIKALKDMGVTSASVMFSFF
jgi:hypothetical protein